LDDDIFRGRFWSIVAAGFKGAVEAFIVGSSCVDETFRENRGGVNVIGRIGR